MKGILLLFTLLLGLLSTSSLAHGAAEKRIVSLSPALTEVAYTLGGGESLVGRSSACDAPPEARLLPAMGDFALPNLEKILACHPDVVISNDLVNPGIAKALQKQGIQVELLPCRSIPEYLAMIRRMGEIFGRTEAAQTECLRVERFLEEFSRQKLPPRRAVMMIWGKPIILAGEETFCYELLQLAGGGGIDLRSKKGFFTPSTEWLLAQRPERIVVFQKGAEDFFRNGALRSLVGAIRYFPEPSLLQRPTPRWTEGVQKLRELLQK